MNNNIIQDKALAGMLQGIETITKLIRPTYGGMGSNVILQSTLYPYFQTVNDAESIVQSVKITDPAEHIALLMVQELCSKQDKTAGNGRKTSIIIAEEILRAAYEYSGNKNELCKALQSYIPLIEKQIDMLTTEITVDNVLQVATTASESEDTGKLFQEIYPQIGKSGIINIEGSRTYETSYKITDGIRFEMTGMLSPEMVHDEEAVKDKIKESKAVYEKPYILVTKKKIVTEDDINPVLVEMRNRDKKDLVIFTNDMDSGVASLLVRLHKDKAFNICIIKAPTLWQDYVFEDFAQCVGATIVEDKTGLSFKNLGLEHLGTCGRIEIDSEDTVLTGIQDISEHKMALQKKGDDDSLLRLSWLTNKSALLKLGSYSHQDLSYKRLKANDANRSVYLALQYGVVKGGGVCLDEVANEISVPNDAWNILSKALKAPLEQNRANGCPDVPEHIVDASMVVKMSVRNAVGIASQVLTAPSIVYIPKLTPEEMAYNMAMKQANPFNQ